MIFAAALLIAVAGAPLDRGDFRTARPLGDVKPGLVSLVLDADALAHSRNLDDVRIVDGHDNQVPYIVEIRTPVVVPLKVPAPAHEGSRTTYHFTIPFDALPHATKLELTTPARVFERCLDLRGNARDWEQQCWSSSDPDKAAPPLVFDCRTTDAEVVVDDGDNAPLPIASAKLFLPGYALRFTAPGGPLTLLYGASLPPPHYDLALIAPRLLAQPARELKPPPLARKEAHTETHVFWIAIAAAVVVLLAILGRLLVRS